MQTGSTTTTSSKTAKSKTAAKPRKSAKSPPTLHLKDQHLATTSSGSDLASMIATAAYFRAQQRGFEPGHELDDWLYAERQVRKLVS